MAPGLLSSGLVRWIAIVLGLVLAACDLGVADPEPVDPTQAESSTACSGACHGAGGQVAPPADTSGRTDTGSIGVGAHAQHLSASAWHKRVECGSCHQVPEQIGDAGHIDTALPAELTFGGMGDGATWNRDAQSCTNSYCHGATLSATIGNTTGASAGGTATEPVWTKVDGSQTQCGGCHGAPPPAPHPADPDCGKCHPTMNPGSMVIAYPELHIDGHLDVVDASSCDSCHGQSGQSQPPKDTLGNVATTARGVGAHAQHTAAASSWHAPINCTECHKVPAGVNDQGHIDSALPAELVFGPIAGAASTWNGTACSNTYCHGGGTGVLKGGSKPSPVWTQVDGTQSQCGSCHGAPPPAPHPSDSNCASCHPTMTAGGGMTIAYPALHIDGKVDIIQDQPCNACHGSASNPAPPMDTTGGTTTDLRTVGAHQSHLAPSTWRKDIACETCHRVPTQVFQIGHIDTPRPAEIAFAPIAGNATWNGTSCNNTYCHGAGLGGGTSKNPTWTVINGAQAQCGSCHGAPPPAPHPVDQDCGKCHDTMTAGGGLVITDPTRHIDGNLDVTGDQACNSCHGGTNNAPPKDTAGNTATTARGVGAHQQHLATTTRFAPIACNDCHRVPGAVTSVGHLDTNLPAELTFSPRAGTSTAFNGSRCSNNYCHGSSLTGGSATAPLWTTVNGTQAQCSSCHGNPPTSAPHTPATTNCSQCHPNSDPTDATKFLDPAKHVDGNVDVDSNQQCNSCHGGTNNAPPKDTTNNTTTTSRGVGAHQAHVVPNTLHRDIQCGECHRVPSAIGSVGHIDTQLPAELTFTGVGAGTLFNGSTCTSYCHGGTLGAGGNATTPLWTKVDGTQAQCTSCHANPPASHATYNQNTQCNNCHASGGTNGVFTDKTKHVDGILQATSNHPAGYNAREMHGYDFDSQGSAGCATASCHGTTLAGGTTGGPACTSCHQTWQTTCTFCHGTSGQGSPPQGVKAETAATDKHVGAHAKHVGATAMHAAWDCSYCHTTPSTALTPGHVDGVGGVVQAEIKYNTLNPAGTFAAATTTCASLYCHGNGRTSTGTAVWTSTAPLSCTSCHPTTALTSGEHKKHIRDENMTCNQCHQTVVNNALGIIAPALHVDGKKDVKMPTGTWNVATKACSGLPGGCHGTKTW